MTSEALPRTQRIRRRPDFERAYNTGSRIHGRFMTVFVVANGMTTPRFGVAATRKLGSAVERNLAKRRSRELFRRHKVAAGLDIIIVPRRDLLDAPFTTLEADYIATLRRSRNAAAGSAAPRHASRRARNTPRL